MVEQSGFELPTLLFGAYGHPVLPIQRPQRIERLSPRTTPSSAGGSALVNASSNRNRIKGRPVFASRGEFEIVLTASNSRSSIAYAIKPTAKANRSDVAAGR
jgi:hypothetical protein